ncbi:MAG TPA: flagellar basal body rod C-terminal domain-containing protein, partial [Acetobacteraceae bacterium]|nr:flagellar basal body rod C-terminal domain-containing protein [Acetobacteraceae bacterium]
LVRVKQVGEDESAFPLRYDPTNPAANAAGYVKVPNVNTFIEMTDMRDAEQSYSANLQVLSVSRSMLTRVIGMLK